MEEEIREALEAGKILTKVMHEDAEFIELTAKLAKKYLDSYIDEGFTREEAITLVAAIANKSN